MAWDSEGPQHSRLPRFVRAAEPPAFRLTDDDLTKIRFLARDRFLRSSHVAALVARSLDRTNDRLCKLYHAGYIDRPRAQLDYHPTGGTSPFVYALADRGARLLIQHDRMTFANVEWSRKNHRAGRPFIEHQLEIADFSVSLQHTIAANDDVRLHAPDELAISMPKPARAGRDAFAMRVSITDKGARRETGLVPDYVFALAPTQGARRNFLVEIDRGTMPIERRDITQTSFARKMRCYLAVHAARQHVAQFGWQSFRVLTVTTDVRRAKSMRDALQKLRMPNGAGPSLFLFTTREELLTSDPLSLRWIDGTGRAVGLL